MVSVMARMKVLTIGYGEAVPTIRGRIRPASMSVHGVLDVGYTAIGVRPCDGIDKSNLYCCDDGTTGVGSFACCSNKSTTFNYDNITSLPTIIATMPLHDVATASPSSIATSASTDESIPTQSTASTCDVIFQGLKATSGGQTVKIVGNVPALGNWDTTKAVTLSASSYASNNPLWKATITLPAGQAIQYKYILVDADGSIIWEADPARTYHVAKSCANSTSPNVIPTESWNSSGSSLGSGDSSGGASRSASSSSSNQIALGVGLGVGLPATAAIIGGIWFAIWRSRRRQSAPQSGPQQEAPGDTASKSPTLQSPPVHSITPKPHELPSCYDARELPA
ncbi:carbohydrate-binding module family 20 protein [Hypoxylon sp. FL0543]|nr:carbohydrate-binding module family 20 protein [Hypoxylon sp. FL0543]